MRWDVETSIDSEGGYLMARLDDFGLRGLVMENATLSASQDKERWRRTQVALDAFRKETKHPNDIAEFYKWLKA